MLCYVMLCYITIIDIMISIIICIIIRINSSSSRSSGMIIIVIIITTNVRRRSEEGHADLRALGLRRGDEHVGRHLYIYIYSINVRCVASTQFTLPLSVQVHGETHALTSRPAGFDSEAAGAIACSRRGQI